MSTGDGCSQSLKYKAFIFKSRQRSWKMFTFTYFLEQILYPFGGDTFFWGGGTFSFTNRNIRMLRLC